jgi:hypothetical protein
VKSSDTPRGTVVLEAGQGRRRYCHELDPETARSFAAELLEAADRADDRQRSTMQRSLTDYLRHNAVTRCPDPGSDELKRMNRKPPKAASFGNCPPTRRSE